MWYGRKFRTTFDKCLKLYVFNQGLQMNRTFGILLLTLKLPNRLKGRDYLRTVRKLLMPITLLIILTGCNDSKEVSEAPQEVANEVSEIPQEVTNHSEDNDTTENVSPESNTLIDLMDVLSLNKQEIIKLLGEPQQLFESEGSFYLEYEGLTISLNPSEEVKHIEIQSDKYLINGNSIGQMPDDIRKVNGKATIEGISEMGDSFEIVYETTINENQLHRLYFASSNFKSPIDYISFVVEDTTPPYTLDEVKEMIIGSWVREGDMLNGDYSDLVYFTENQIITNSFNGTISGLRSLYNVTNHDTIEISGINSYSDYEHEQFEVQTLEFSPDGERIDIYRVDSHTGEIFEDSRQVYYKYSDSIVVK